MKKLLYLFVSLAVNTAFGQSYSFVNGDPKFMDRNPAYDESNPSQDEYILKAGMPDGSYTIFYDAGMQNVFQKGFMQGGHRIKSWAYYTRDQHPKMEIEYDEAGLISGIVREYYPGGAIMTETQFRNNQANGMMVSYYESGKKKMQCGMKNNNPDGKAVFYDESGKVTQSMEYKYEK